MCQSSDLQEQLSGGEARRWVIALLAVQRRQTFSRNTREDIEIAALKYDESQLTNISY